MAMSNDLAWVIEVLIYSALCGLILAWWLLQ
jgi:hypothetical protein